MEERILNTINLIEYVSRPMKKEDVLLLYRVNNVTPERTELYLDFVKSLFKLVTSTYLGDDIMDDKEIKKHFKVGKNSWINDLDIIEDVKKDANNNKNVVFLFAAGVLSNIAVRELHEYNNKNFYIDIGSTLDVDLDLGETRLYLKGGQTLNKICVW